MAPGFDSNTTEGLARTAPFVTSSVSSRPSGSSESSGPQAMELARDAPAQQRTGTPQVAEQGPSVYRPRAESESEIQRPQPPVTSRTRRPTLRGTSSPQRIAKFFSDFDQNVSRLSKTIDETVNIKPEMVEKILKELLPGIIEMNDLCEDWTDVDEISTPSDGSKSQERNVFNTNNAQKLAKTTQLLEVLYSKISRKVSEDYDTGTPATSSFARRGAVPYSVEVSEQNPVIYINHSLEVLSSKIKELNKARRQSVDHFGEQSKSTFVEDKTHIDTKMFNKAIMTARVGEKRTKQDHHSIFKNILATGQETGVYSAERLNTYLDDRATTPAHILKDITSEYKKILNDYVPESEQSSTTEAVAAHKKTAFDTFTKLHKLENMLGEDPEHDNPRNHVFIKSLQAYGISHEDIKTAFSATNGQAKEKLDEIIQKLGASAQFERKAINESPDYTNIKEATEKAEGNLVKTKKLAYGLRALGKMNIHKRTFMDKLLARNKSIVTEVNRENIVEQLKVCIQKGVLDLGSPALRTDRRLDSMHVDIRHITDKNIDAVMNELGNADLDVLVDITTDVVKAVQRDFKYSRKLLIDKVSIDTVQEAYNIHKNDIIENGLHGEHTDKLELDPVLLKEQKYHNWSKRMLKGRSIKLRTSIESGVIQTLKEGARATFLAPWLVGSIMFNGAKSLVAKKDRTPVTDKKEIEKVKRFRELNNLPELPERQVTVHDVKAVKYGGYSKRKFTTGRTWSHMNKQLGGVQRYHSQVGEASIGLDGAFAGVGDQISFAGGSNAGIYGSFAASDTFNGIFQSSFAGLKFRMFLGRRLAMPEKKLQKTEQIIKNTQIIKKQIEKIDPVDFRRTMIQSLAEMADSNASGNKRLLTRRADRVALDDQKRIDKRAVQKGTSATLFHGLRRKAYGSTNFYSKAHVTRRMTQWIENTAFTRYVWTNLFSLTRGLYFGVRAVKPDVVSATAAATGSTVLNSLGLVSGATGTILLSSNLTRLEIIRKNEKKYIKVHKNTLQTNEHTKAAKKNPVYKMSSESMTATMRKSHTVKRHELNMGWTWDTVFACGTIYSAMALAGAMTSAASGGLLIGNVFGISAMAVFYNIWSHKKQNATANFKASVHSAILGASELDTTKKAGLFGKTMSKLSKTYAGKVVGSHKTWATSDRGRFMTRMVDKHPDLHLDNEANRYDLHTYRNDLSKIIKKVTTEAFTQYSAEQKALDDKRNTQLAAVEGSHREALEEIYEKDKINLKAERVGIIIKSIKNQVNTQFRRDVSIDWNIISKDIDILLTNIDMYADSPKMQKVVISDFSRKIAGLRPKRDSIEADGSENNRQPRLLKTSQERLPESQHSPLLRVMTDSEKVQAASVTSLAEEDSDMTMMNWIDGLRQEMALTDVEEEKIESTVVQEREKRALEEVNSMSSRLDRTAKGEVYKSTPFKRAKYRGAEGHTPSEQDQGLYSLQVTEDIGSKIAKFTDRGEVDAARFKRSDIAGYMRQMKIPDTIIQAIADSSPTRENNAAAIKVLKMYTMGRRILGQDHIEKDALYEVPAEERAEANEGAAIAG